jgi:hypothetical protein
MTLATTMIDHGSPADPTDAPEGANIERLASIGRELAYNDPQGSQGARGEPEDRNVLIRFDRPPPVTPLEPHPYTDVPGWIETAVRWAHAHQYVTGYPGGFFRPNFTATRGQVANLLYGIADRPDVSAMPPLAFGDVPVRLEDAVRWLTNPDNDPPYATGYQDGTFRHRNPITRAELARMLYRIEGAPDVSGYPPLAFADVPGWAADAVRWLTNPDNDPRYATGYRDGTFRPDEPITRAELTRMLYRIYGSTSN